MRPDYPATGHLNTCCLAILCLQPDAEKFPNFQDDIYRGAVKSLVRPGRKQATATEDFGVHISYLL